MLGHKSKSALARTADGIESMVTDRPKSVVGAVILIILGIAFSVWMWPEVHRTVKIHRM